MQRIGGWRRRRGKRGQSQQETGGVACSGDDVTAGGGRGNCRSLARKARVRDFGTARERQSVIPPSSAERS